MAKLRSSGETALRARKLRQKARLLEAQPNTNDAESHEATAEAKELRIQAGELDRAARWFAYMDQMPMVGPPKGPRDITKERAEFLQSVSKNIGEPSREAVAQWCVTHYSAEVRRLWELKGSAFFRRDKNKKQIMTPSGQKALNKLLDFMRNNKVC